MVEVFDNEKGGSTRELDSEVVVTVEVFTSVFSFGITMYGSGRPVLLPTRLRSVSAVESTIFKEGIFGSGFPSIFLLSSGFTPSSKDFNVGLKFVLKMFPG